MAGTAATFIAGPWVGSTRGVAVARVLRRVGAEIERWLLAPRQERRSREAAEAAFDEIEAQLDAGHEVRADVRESDISEDESPAVELLEGVLRTAADEWEQREVPYIGRIFAGLAFDASVTPAEGSYLIKVAELRPQACVAGRGIGFVLRPSAARQRFGDQGGAGIVVDGPAL